MRLKELREGIITTLKGYAGLTALLSTDPVDSSPAVYDHVDQVSTFPYVVVGEPVGSQHDADDCQGWEGEVVLHIWSEFRGFEEVVNIGRQLTDALHRAEPTITDARIVTLHRESFGSVLDPDGLRRHGIYGFRVILEEL